MVMWFSLSFIAYGIIFTLPMMVVKMREASGQSISET
jgi:hypothetical protein